MDLKKRKNGPLENGKCINHIKAQSPIEQEEEKCEKAYQHDFNLRLKTQIEKTRLPSWNSTSTKTRVFTGKNWNSLIRQCKNVLNELSEFDYREAPYIQHALVAINNSLQEINNENNQLAKAFLMLALDDLNNADKISSYRANTATASKSAAKDPREIMLLTAISHLQATFDTMRNYLNDRCPVKLFRACKNFEAGVLAVLTSGDRVT